MTRIAVLGTEIDSTTLNEAVEKALTVMPERNGSYVITPNTEYLLRAVNECDLRTIAQQAFLSLPDGVGVLAAARIQNKPLFRRVPGIEVASVLLRKMGEQERSVFLLGGRPGVAETAGNLFKNHFPGLVVKGAYNGFFDAEEETEICRRINEASPDLLIVCLGSPRQERWMYKHGAALHVGLMAGLGGTLDVFAGRVKRAPAPWRKAGFEWLYRTIREPKRIKRTFRLPLILLVSLWYRVRGK